MKRGLFWKKYYVVLALLFLAFLPAFSESVEVPELEPTEEYVMTGEDIMTLYQTINDLNETKTEYQNLANEMMRILKDAEKYLDECASENKKLTFKNKILFGTTVVSTSICLTGIITYFCLNTK